MLKNIVLIGFMGAGKTTLGSFLAQRLKFAFVDIDQEVVRSLGLSIRQIFGKKGEAFFRKKETEQVSHFITREKTVLVAGGGAVPALLKIKSHLKFSWVVYLEWQFSDLWPRLQGLTDRPLLSQFNKREIEKLFHERHLYYYALANQRIEGKLPVEQATQLICTRFRFRERAKNLSTFQKNKIKVSKD